MENINSSQSYENDNDVIITENLVSFPVKSFTFSYKGNKITSDINSFSIDAPRGEIVSQGIDQYGNFNLFAKINYSSDDKNNIIMKKIYDTHIIDITLNYIYNANKFEGLWKTPNNPIFDVNNTVELELNLVEYDCFLQEKDESEDKSEIKKFKIWSNFLLEGNTSEYTGLILNDEVFPDVIEGSVYDITHVIYCYVKNSKEKKYYSGRFDFDKSAFYLTKAELI
jgi:hypothetical protein